MWKIFFEIDMKVFLRIALYDLTNGLEDCFYY